MERSAWSFKLNVTFYWLKLVAFICIHTRGVYYAVQDGQVSLFYFVCYNPNTWFTCVKEIAFNILSSECRVRHPNCTLYSSRGGCNLGAAPCIFSYRDRFYWKIYCTIFWLQIFQKIYLLKGKKMFFDRCK